MRTYSPSKIVLSVLTATSLLITAGCNNTSVQEIEKLQQENAALKAEIDSLKAQMQSSGSTPGVATMALSTKTFTDIDNTPTKGFIRDLAKLGVFDEMSDTFSPRQPITRGEFTTWLVKSYNKIMPVEKQIRVDPGSSSTFKDLKAEHPAFPYVQALANAGYSVGYDDGTFKPDQPITREEMLGIKTGVDAGKAITGDRGMFELGSLTDAKEVSDRFVGAIQHANEFKSDLGSSMQLAFGNIRTLKPKQQVLRHEAAAALWQFGGGLGSTATTAADILKDQSEAVK